MTDTEKTCSKEENACAGGLMMLGALLAIGLSVSGYFIGNTLYKAKTAENIATVKGLAERNVKSDLAIWTLSFSLVGPQLDGVFADAKQDRETIAEFLKEQGFKASEIRMEPLNSWRNEYRDNGKLVDESFNVSSGVTVETSDIERVSEAYAKAGELIGRGVVLSSSTPRYLYTKLNDIKPELLGEATKSARVAAEQFAGDAGGKVGGIKTATQGNFSILAKNSTESYGEDESSIAKTVRVVTTITFYME